MAFISLMFANIVIVLLFIALILIIICFITAIVLKVVGKAKDSKPMRITGNVFLILGIVIALPIVILFGIVGIASSFSKITLPDGEDVYVSSKKIYAVYDLIETNSDDTAKKLDKILNKNPEFVYHLDINHEGILEHGIESGNADVVEVALKHGAILDNPERYDHMAYVHCSMEDFLSELSGEEVTEDTVRIAGLLFEYGADTNLCYKYDEYSNAFGKAAWIILTNDETVTDTELEFLQVFIDNGLSSDNGLLNEEKPYNVLFHDVNVIKDENYEKVMEIIEKQTIS